MACFHSCLWLIFCLILLCAKLRSSLTIGINDFFPFGREHGDSQLKPGDDESSVLIPFVSAFKFFDQQCTSVSVLTNGLLSLNQSNVISNFIPVAFPMGRILIAPFWADADTRGIGTVFFRTTANETLLNKMAKNVSRFFDTDFLPIHLFISTWYKVGYFNGKKDKTNTFQCILASDDSSSFIIFLYEEGGMQWASGDETKASEHKGLSSMMVNNAGFATVGFDAGDGKHYINVPGSNLAIILNISATSNVNIPGVWAFQVNAPPTSPTTYNDVHTSAMTTATVTNKVTETSVGNATWALTSVFVVLGVCFLVLLPGAIYGYIRVGKVIFSGEKELFKNSSSSSEILNKNGNKNTALTV